MLVTFGPCGSRPQPGPVADLGVFSRGAGQGVGRKNVGRRPGFIYLCVEAPEDGRKTPKRTDLEVFPSVGPFYGLGLKCPQLAHVLNTYSSAGGRCYLGICRTFAGCGLVGRSRSLEKSL